MPVQRIIIDQQFAQIGIRSSLARMQISSPESRINIQNQRPQLQVNTELPRFRVPRERLRNELNLAGPLSFAREFANKGRSGGHQATATYASEGDFIASKNIPGEKSIPMMVSNKMRQYFRKPDTNIGLMPSSPPSLDWEKGVIDINFSGHRVAVDWSGSNTADISVEHGYPVEVSLSRQAHFRVMGIEPAVENRTYGRFIDRSV